MLITLRNSLRCQFIVKHRNILSTNFKKSICFSAIFSLVILLVYSSRFYDFYLVANVPRAYHNNIIPNGYFIRETTNTKVENFLKQPNANTGPIKTILIYNEIFGTSRIRLFVGTGTRMFRNNQCKINRCKLYVNPYLTKKKPLNSYNAVVFYIDAFTETSKMIKDLSKNQERTKRMSSQRYVALRVEPPVDPPVGYSIKKDLLENFFNWSMSYRQDADIQLPYGTIIRPLQEREKPGRRWNRIRTMNESKNGSSAVVAWMVSHCSTDSKREDYVKGLRKFIDVDIYGKCGNNLKCKSDKINGMSSSECYDMIESKYKFYLSFENSICPDYVTEKFFRIAQLDSVVPVVYGGADYSRIAPPHSYINARQFEPKKLADYLKKLDADDALFEEYLRWKDNYVVENSREIAIQNAFCDLCRKLHQDDEPMKVYNRVIDWFHPENTCVIDAPE